MNKSGVPAIFWLCILLIGCSPMHESEIRNNEIKWAEQSIDHYEIEVIHIRSIWHVQTYTLRVGRGIVIDAWATCIPAPAESGSCEVEAFEAIDFTVPGLFRIARTQAQVSDGEWTKIQFDEHFGFPRQISFDDPEILDEDVSWQVTRFEVVP